jgi:rhodanese-related sulfurtransferase
MKQLRYGFLFWMFFALTAWMGFSSCAEMKGKKEMIVDVRTAEEYMNGSVEGAVNIPLHEIQKRLNEFKDQKSILVFCQSGTRSALAKRVLEENGITGVTDGGGIDQVREKLKSGK